MRRLIIDFTRLTSGGGRTIGENLLAAIEPAVPSGLEITSLVPSLYARLPEPPTSTHEIRRIAFRSSFESYFFYSRTIPRLLRRGDAYLGMCNWGIRRHPSLVRRVVYFHQPWMAYEPRREVMARLTVAERLSLKLLRSQLRNWREYADALIVQTEVMKARLMARYSIPADSMAVIPPPIASRVDAATGLPDLPRRLAGRIGIAYVSAYYAHKNFEILPHVARILKERRLRQFVFVLTLSEDELTGRARPFLETIRDLGVADFFEFLGRVPSASVAAVVRDCGIALNISEMESFTGSILETVAAGVPLVCSDRDFFTALCERGFFACEPGEPESIVTAILAAEENRQTSLRIRRGILGDVPDYTAFARRLVDVLKLEA